MSSPVKFLSLLIPFAVISVAFALFEEPRELQEIGAQVSEVEGREFSAFFSDKFNTFGRFLNWTTCNASETSLLSCLNCHTRLLCLSNNRGIAIPCPKTFLQHCNRGTCSRTKSPDC